MSNSAPFISWLLSAYDRELLSVKALFHVFDSVRCSSPQEIELVFEGAFGRIYGDKDGATLCFSPVESVECDLGEYGSQRIFSISDGPVFSKVVGRTLRSASLIQSLRDKTMVGVEMDFDEGAKVFIMNLGDEIFVFDVIPEKIIEEEQLVFYPVSK
jgi:hypothetical protein